jgi:hypothetical protein
MFINGGEPMLGKKRLFFTYIKKVDLFKSDLRQKNKIKEHKPP